MLLEILPHRSNRKDIKDLLLCVSVENEIRCCIVSPAGSIALNICQQLKEHSSALADPAVPFDFYLYLSAVFDCGKVYIFLPIGRI